MKEVLFMWTANVTKRLSRIGIPLIFALSAPLAAADSADRNFERSSAKYRDQHFEPQPVGRYHKKHNRHHYGEVLRLDLPVHVRGKGKIRLGRLINRHYNINLEHYNLRKVVVHNHSRYGRANLMVGGYHTSRIALHPGRNHIQAPVRDSRGHWKLALRDVYTDHIRVVLEPKYKQRHKRHYSLGEHKGKYDGKYRDKRGYNDWAYYRH